MSNGRDCLSDCEDNRIFNFRNQKNLEGTSRKLHPSFLELVKLATTSLIGSFMSQSFNWRFNHLITFTFDLTN